ncbi:MAG: hypothetical protein QFX35_04345, partial [Candidatus Verstraetearchaeota archaeon]|nr:hypothetical protein [Candidatus Verstraetearchaeota archaeon]
KEWITQVIVTDNNSTVLEYAFPDHVFASKLRINFTKATSFGSVSIWDLEVLSEASGTSKLLGMMGIKHIVLEKTIVMGNKYGEPELNEDDAFVLVKDWGEVSLYENSRVVEKIYVADNLIVGRPESDSSGSSTDSMTETDPNYTQRAVLWMVSALEGIAWDDVPRTAFVLSDPADHAGTELSRLNLSMPSEFEWIKVNPTLYKATANANGTFLLVFLESYSEDWRLYVNGDPVPDELHIKVNGFANGWIVKGTGDLELTLEYAPQRLLVYSSIASVLLPIVLLVFLFRRKIMEDVRRVKGKFALLYLT